MKYMLEKYMFNQISMHMIDIVYVIQRIECSFLPYSSRKGSYQSEGI